MNTVTLDDKYTAVCGRIYLSGVQALVRLPLMQRLRDEAAGIKTAGFVSGYRGSPLGGLDEAYWKATPLLKQRDVRFVPGVNEDLALTAVWGTQQVHIIGESDYDGVFGLWYAKGPGVDRSADVLKHLNHAGTSKYGGVLLVAGDDHGAYSSTLPHQSDHIFSASMIPLLYPCNVQEYLTLGLHGWAMSRFSGCAVAFKALADTVESSASVDADPFAVQTLIPHDFVMPEGGLNCRLSSDTLGVQARKQEALMQNYKIYAALAYARANRLNHTTIDSEHARLGIIASGKSYMDVLEALEELNIDEAFAAELGIRLFKVAMPWPLEPDGVREFAKGLDEILVVEEKRQVVEYQLKEQLYNWRDDVRPRIIGKFDEKGEWVAPRGEWLLPATADFSVAQIARVIAARIARFHNSDSVSARLRFLEAKEAVLQRAVSTPPRSAYYCSGCPHNSSTKVPDGSLALAGIGCHVMATAIYPEHNKTSTHMGGEGAPWIGAAHYSKRKHVFTNLGDGTYFHSGYLAIRAAIAARVNITYKILYNDAVAMTGGQPVDGSISVHRIAQQMAAEGVQRIALVTEDMGRYTDRSELPARVSLHHRQALDDVQRELREVRGCSVLIYDQTCAAEKRRRRKKKEMLDPPKRLFINAAVCEGCGDCGQQSNCTSLMPLETEFGRKRKIDQSSCNKDFSCVKGFCPSFVSVMGAEPRRLISTKEQEQPPDSLPRPVMRTLDEPFNILITGIGGTGVITLGALMGMAAHIEGKGVSVLDMTGMSQKNGSVTSHVRLAASPHALRAQRIATGEADLILGCDILTAASADAISKTKPGRTLAIVNAHEQPTGHFARQPDWQFPSQEVRDLLKDAVAERVEFVDATALAGRLLGDTMGANLFMLGWAFQRGAIPLSEAALSRAIEINGVAVKMNLAAFAWGRRAAMDLGEVQRITQVEAPILMHVPQSLDALIKTREEYLRAYQNQAYASQYTNVVRQVQRAEKNAGIAGERLAKAVAKNLFKLMAYKDEYEVARLYSTELFQQDLRNAFDGPLKLRFHLAPPIWGKTDAAGRPVKQEFGAWVLTAFKLLAMLKFLRGTAVDIFGKTPERKMERALITEYQQALSQVLSVLKPQNLNIALELVNLPEHIRGFGYIKEGNVHKARNLQAELLKQLQSASM